MTREDSLKSCDSADIRNYVSLAIRAKKVGSLTRSIRALRIAEGMIKAALERLSSTDKKKAETYFRNTF